MPSRSRKNKKNKPKHKSANSNNNTTMGQKNSTPIEEISEFNNNETLAQKDTANNFTPFANSEEDIKVNNTLVNVSCESKSNDDANVIINKEDTDLNPDESENVIEKLKNSFSNANATNNISSNTQVNNQNVNILPDIVCTNSTEVDEQPKENYDSKAGSPPLEIEDDLKSDKLSQEEEYRLKQYLQTLPLAISRDDLVKEETSTKLSNSQFSCNTLLEQTIESNFSPPVAISRCLEVIDEEGSNDSSSTSRRHSYLNDHNFDLEDDVFSVKKPNVVQLKSDKFPKRVQNHNFLKALSPIPQECVLVDTKYIDSGINEGCGAWTLGSTEERSGVEVVYLTDSSGSTSDISNIAEEDHSYQEELPIQIKTPIVEINSLLDDLPALEIKHSSPTINKICISEDISTFSKPENTSKHTLKKQFMDANQSNHLYDFTYDEMHTKPVMHDMHEKNPNTYLRQDSGNSVSSSRSGSQCTAKYNPSSLSLTDLSAIPHDDKRELIDNSNSHVKEVIQNISEFRQNIKCPIIAQRQPYTLREICLKFIADLPYGAKILEELANVSLTLQKFDIFGDNNIREEKNVSAFVRLAKKENHLNKVVPPPVAPRSSSLKNPSEQSPWVEIPERRYTPRIKCHSPSQRMLMEAVNPPFEEFNCLTNDAISPTNINMFTYNKRHEQEGTHFNHEKTPNRLFAFLKNPDIKSDTALKVQDWCDTNIKSTPNLKDHLVQPIRPPQPRTYSAAAYESDGSSDLTDQSLYSVKLDSFQSNYHTNYQKGSKINEIQVKHLKTTNMRNENSSFRRKLSLPEHLCNEQMAYIQQKEKEIEEEIEKLEMARNKAHQPGSKAPLITEKEFSSEKIYNSHDYNISHKRDVAYKTELNNSTFKTKPRDMVIESPEEKLRQKMYSEYQKVIGREERKQHKVIKISTKDTNIEQAGKSLDSNNDNVNANKIEKEFISKAKERWDKLGFKDPETEDERESVIKKEEYIVEKEVKVIEAGELKDVKRLPNHLREFVQFTAGDKRDSEDSPVWTPGQKSSCTQTTTSSFAAPSAPTDVSNTKEISPPSGGVATAESGVQVPPAPPLPPPVWAPKSAGPSPVAKRKPFTPVNSLEESAEKCLEKTEAQSVRQINNNIVQDTPKQNGFVPRDCPTPPCLPASHSVPPGGPASVPNRLPKSQNPTVTLLQKAREGQLPRGAAYIQEHQEKAKQNREQYKTIGSGWRSSGYASEPEGGMSIPRAKVDGIGPITKDGMPVALRSEVKDPSKWYRKMYDTIHKNKYDDHHIKVHYKSPRASPSVHTPSTSRSSNYAYFDSKSGYLSEPEGNSRSRRISSNDADSDLSPYLPSEKYSTLASARAHQEVYRNQPGKIENYLPGKSSVVEKESKQWWDEVMDIFDGWLDENSPFPDYSEFLTRALLYQTDLNKSSTQSLKSKKESVTSSILSKSNMARALKDGGYESDSTLVFRRKGEESPLSPKERSVAYKALQAGGEVPLKGFRSPAPHLDDSDIEYIPISPTLTKIRIHKRDVRSREKAERSTDVKIQKYAPSFISVNIPKTSKNVPPSPPKRLSSKHSKVLKNVVRTTKASEMRKKNLVKNAASPSPLKSFSNLQSRKDAKHIPLKGNETFFERKPEWNLKKNGAKTIDKKPPGTSSFITPRKIMAPVTYTNPLLGKFQKQTPRKVVIEGGAGRKTPITNILDKVCAIDKMWNEERNKKIIRKPLSISKSSSMPKISFQSSEKISCNREKQQQSESRGRTLLRTSDKYKKIFSKPQTINYNKLPKYSENTCSKQTLNKIATASVKSLKSLKIKPKEENHVLKDNIKNTNELKSGESSQITKNIVMNSPNKRIEKKYSLHSDFLRETDFDNVIFNSEDLLKSHFMCSYLNRTKPVTHSKFLFWDRETSLNRLNSPRSLSCPERNVLSPAKNWIEKFDSDSFSDISSMSEVTVRSRSEPSVGKIYFSQTVRPISPMVTFKKAGVNDDKKTNSSTLQKIYFSQSARPVSPSKQHSRDSQSYSPSRKKVQGEMRNVLLSSNKIDNTQSSKSNLINDRKSIPKSLNRSPCSRKIQNLQPVRYEKHYESKRTKSADGIKEREENIPNVALTKCFSNIEIDQHNLDKHYDLSLLYTRSERFRELNRYYRYLEKIGELEKTTSSLEARLRGQQKIIDFDKWKKIRTIERAEEELKKLKSKLLSAQKEHDVLFYPHDVREYKWSFCNDSNLNRREKSVEDLRKKFQSECSPNRPEVPIKKKSDFEFKNQGTACDSTLLDLGSRVGFSKKMLCSLSDDQVKTIKKQLTAIYGKQSTEKLNSNDCSIKVSQLDIRRKPSLKVRSNSFPAVLENANQDKSTPLYVSVNSSKSNADLKTILSESDKRQISRSLSQEVMQRINQMNSNNNETTILKQNKPRQINNERKVEANIHNQILSKSLIDFDEIGSSDASTDTVVLRNIPETRVKEKVEFFENVSELVSHSPTIYQPGDDSDMFESDLESDETLIPEVKNEKNVIKNNSYRSTSCSNFKEIFGETNINTYSSLPTRSKKKTIATYNTASKEALPEITFQTSQDSLNYSQSSSPDPEKYWRAYLYLTRSGEVSRLTKKFESPNIRRHKSDPELARRILMMEWPRIKTACHPTVDELTFRFESRSRVRRRRSLLSPVPLRNRFMPHIDVISKTAALNYLDRAKNVSKNVECQTGEVRRLKEVFENAAKSKRRTTSAPDFRFLSSQWTAHKFPKQADNYRREEKIEQNSVLKHPKRPRSTPSLYKGEWNPDLHRPVSRYVPSHHSVKFQEPDYAPTPPLKGSSNGYSKFTEPRRQYVESDVNIHYKCPVRRDPLPYVPEKELARTQAEHMKRVYQEERRRKYIQELQDLQNRRHTDNFTPSQKAVVPLNRYDDAPANPGARTKARVLYDFASQTPRELNLKKGNIVIIRRQIDANWYEGEFNGKVGLFPYNYVEVIKLGTDPKPSKPVLSANQEGKARAKFDFMAQTNLELPLKKGELVVLIRRVDENWWEGRIGSRVGIFPDSYIQVLDEPFGAVKEPLNKPVASPASHGLMNGAARSSMGPHSYTPQINSPALSNAPQPNQPLNTSVKTSYKTRITERSMTRSPAPTVEINNHSPLYIDTNADTVPYKAMYKYKPQNPDELELLEGDTVYVVEKCDDGWFVGTSKRTQKFGTFPGNYVERIA